MIKATGGIFDKTHTQDFYFKKPLLTRRQSSAT